MAEGFGGDRRHGWCGDTSGSRSGSSPIRRENARSRRLIVGFGTPHSENLRLQGRITPIISETIALAARIEVEIPDPRQAVRPCREPSHDAEADGLDVAHVGLGHDVECRGQAPSPVRRADEAVILQNVVAVRPRDDVTARPDQRR